MQIIESGRLHVIGSVVAVVELVVVLVVVVVTQVPTQSVQPSGISHIDPSGHCTPSMPPQAIGVVVVVVVVHSPFVHVLPRGQCDNGLHSRQSSLSK